MQDTPETRKCRIKTFFGICRPRIALRVGQKDGRLVFFVRRYQEFIVLGILDIGGSIEIL